jgi:L-fuconolactonase
LRLDAHQYFTTEHLPEHLEPILRRNRFEGSIAVAQTPRDTRLLLEAAARHEFIRGVIGCCAAPRDLDEFRRHPQLLGLVFGAESTDLSSTFVGAGTCCDLRMTPVEALRVLERFPDAKAALVHLGFPDGSDAWFRAIEQLAVSRNVYVKASGLITQFPQPWNAAHFRPYVQHVLALFGPRRVMFGSDWPGCLPVSIWKETLAAFTQAIGPQPLEAREEMLGRAACRFYGIDFL